MTIETVSFILGGLLVAVGVLGGGIEVKELKIPSVGQTSRLLCFVVGAAFIGLAIYLSHRPQSVPGVELKPIVQGAPNNPVEWLTSAQYQQLFNNKRDAGFYPVTVEGKCENGGELFRAEWKIVPNGKVVFTHHGITKDVYDGKNQEYISQGYALTSFNTFKDCSGTDRYQATWIK